MQAIVRKSDDRLVAINGTGISFSVYDPLTRYEVEIPDQDVSAYYETRVVGESEESFLKPVIFPAGLLLFSAEEKALRLDKDTGKAIRAALHPFCGADESDAINRDQIVKILNALGLEPTPEFAAKNEIAIAEIEKAQIEKEAL